MMRMYTGRRFFQSPIESVRTAFFRDGARFGRNVSRVAKARRYRSPDTSRHALTDASFLICFRRTLGAIWIAISPTYTRGWRVVCDRSVPQAVLLGGCLALARPRGLFGLR